MKKDLLRFTFIVGVMVLLFTSLIVGVFLMINSNPYDLSWLFGLILVLSNILSAIGGYLFANKKEVENESKRTDKK